MSDNPIFIGIWQGIKNGFQSAIMDCLLSQINEESASNAEEE